MASQSSQESMMDNAGSSIMNMIPAHLRTDRTKKEDTIFQKLNRWNSTEQAKMVYFKVSSVDYVQESMNDLCDDYTIPNMSEDEDDDDVFFAGLPPEPPKSFTYVPPPRKVQGRDTGPHLTSAGEGDPIKPGPSTPTTKELGFIQKSEIEKLPLPPKPYRKLLLSSDKYESDSVEIMITNQALVETISESKSICTFELESGRTNQG